MNFCLYPTFEKHDVLLCLIVPVFAVEKSLFNKNVYKLFIRLKIFRYRNNDIDGEEIHDLILHRVRCLRI